MARIFGLRHFFVLGVEMMLIKIGGFECTEVWDGVLYKNLSDYPRITDWELRTIIEFVEYEKTHGRECTVECADESVLAKINRALQNRDAYRNAPRPALQTECTACRHCGCVTEFVCHTTSPENAVKILECGKLLSALRARKVSVEMLMAESRNAANDPADYFEYIMLAWGNCQAGDRLVMERKLGRCPNETDLSEDFTPGVRFCFRYDELAEHPNRVFDGVLPMKIRHEIDLKDWLYALVIPVGTELEVPDYLQDRTIYVENDCKDIWEWSEKVYQAIEQFGGKG